MFLRIVIIFVFNVGADHDTCPYLINFLLQIFLVYNIHNNENYLFLKFCQQGARAP